MMTGLKPSQILQQAHFLLKVLCGCPGIVVAAGAMEFMRVGSKVSEAMGSVFNIFKQGMKGRKNSN